MNDATTWVVTDGRIGMVNQATGLAEAVGFDFAQKTVCPGRPWRWLPPVFWAGTASGIGPGSDPFEPPWPSLVISCGRHATGPALWIKSRSGGRSFIVHVQHPRLDPTRFDLVVAPTHDGLEGPNVMPVLGAMNRVTAAKLESAAAAYAPTLAALPRPLITVLLGGSNRVFRFTEAAADELADGLLRLTREHGAGLAITPSRRTDPAALERLRARLCDAPATIWDGSGDNPYFGYLGLADAIVVTGDSVNMMTEACATGRPVYIAVPPGRGDSKFSAFHATLADAGIARPFEGTLETWSYEPLNETARIAAEVRRRMGFAD
ncbi:MAG: mitochondrial fission ELM1 family protein [Alphaproteobacteria bacterium]|nr:mitochondrial fission ELM1 family protein [Alphaproteobacteria bacterium]